MKRHTLQLVILICCTTSIIGCRSTRLGWTDPPLIPVAETSLNIGETRYGYLDAGGTIRIKPQFVEAGHFSEGLARVMFENHRWGYINEHGEPVITLDKNVVFAAYVFHEGMALVNVGGEDGEIDDHTIYGGKWGYINTAGEFVIQPQFETSSGKRSRRYASHGYFRNGRALVPVTDGWGYIDKNGTLVIQGPFDEATVFFNGIAEVYTRKQISDDVIDGDTYWINRTGKVLWKD